MSGEPYNANVRWSINTPIGKVSTAPMINLSRLPPEQKRVMWARIKQEQPALAALLQDDTVAAFRDVFAAEILIYQEDMPHAQ